MFGLKDGFIISLSYGQATLLPRSTTSTSRDAVFAVYMADYHVVHKALLTVRISEVHEGTVIDCTTFLAARSGIELNSIICGVRLESNRVHPGRTLMSR